MTERLFGFVQWEFPGRLGPDPGRYPVRRFAGDDVREIVVITGLTGPRRTLLPRPRRRPKAVEEAAMEPIDVTRATVVDAEPMFEPEKAEAWLEQAVGDQRAEVVDRALGVLNRAVAAHRVAAADPYVPDAGAGRALATRIGYGRGDQVAEGDWVAARQLPPPSPEEWHLVVPQLRVAELLSGRDVALACEELLLRARADLAAGRQREAAMQAHLALESGVAELESWREHRDMAARIDELAGLRPGVAEAANAAIQGGIEPEAVAGVEEALARLAAALRARAVR